MAVFLRDEVAVLLKDGVTVLSRDGITFLPRLALLYSLKKKAGSSKGWSGSSSNLGGGWQSF